MLAHWSLKQGLPWHQHAPKWIVGTICQAHHGAVHLLSQHIGGRLRQELQDSLEATSHLRKTGREVAGLPLLGTFSVSSLD